MRWRATRRPGAGAGPGTHDHRSRRALRSAAAVLAGLAALCALPAQAGPAAAEDGPGGSTSAPGDDVQERQGNGDSIEPGSVYSGELGPTGGGTGQRYYRLKVPESDAHAGVSVSVTASARRALSPGTPRDFSIAVTMTQDGASTPCDERSGTFDGSGSPAEVTVTASCRAADEFMVQVVRNDSNDSLEGLDLTLSPGYGTPSPTASPPSSPAPGRTTTDDPANGAGSDSGTGTGADAASQGHHSQQWEVVAATAFGTGTALVLVLVIWTVLARRHARPAGS